MQVQRDIREGHAETVAKVLRIIDREGGIKGKTCCDVGCGTGSLSIPLVERVRSLAMAWPPSFCRPGRLQSEGHASRMHWRHEEGRGRHGQRCAADSPPQMHGHHLDALHCLERPFRAIRELIGADMDASDENGTQQGYETVSEKPAHASLQYVTLIAGLHC